MPQSKRIILASLLCLLFFTTKLYALETNKLGKEKQKTHISLNSISKSLHKSINEAKSNFGKNLDKTLEDIDYFLNDAGVFVGDLAKSVAVVAALIFYEMAKYDGYHYNNYYDSGYMQSYDHSWPHSYNDGLYQ